MWPSVFDVPRPIAGELRLEQNFFHIFNALRLPMYNFQRFEIPEDKLRVMCGGDPWRRNVQKKAAKQDEGWKLIHESLFPVGCCH